MGRIMHCGKNCAEGLRSCGRHRHAVAATSPHTEVCSDLHSCLHLPSFAQGLLWPLEPTVPVHEWQACRSEALATPGSSPQPVTTDRSLPRQESSHLPCSLLTPSCPRRMEPQLPTVATGSKMYPLLTAFSFLSHSPTPLPVSSGTTSQTTCTETSSRAVSERTQITRVVTS